MILRLKSPVHLKVITQEHPLGKLTDLHVQKEARFQEQEFTLAYKNFSG